MFFISISIVGVNDNSINGIRLVLYDAIIEDYELVIDSRNGNNLMSKMQRDEAILRVNNHGLRLNDMELEALSSIINIVQAQYRLDNAKGTQQELIDYENFVASEIERLKVMLMIEGESTQ